MNQSVFNPWMLCPLQARHSPLSPSSLSKIINKIKGKRKHPTKRDTSIYESFLTVRCDSQQSNNHHYHCQIQYHHYIKYVSLVYTTQMNSAFCVYWLAGLKVINKYSSPWSSRGDKIMHQKFNFQPFFCIFTEICWFFLSFCVVCTVYILIQLFTSVQVSKWWIIT